MVDIPREEQLLCGHVDPSDPHKCNECSTRDSRELGCYRTGDINNGICIALEDCPAGKTCFSECVVGSGCFGNICNASTNQRRDCNKICKISNGAPAYYDKDNGAPAYYDKDNGAPAYYDKDNGAPAYSQTLQRSRGWNLFSPNE